MRIYLSLLGWYLKSIPESLTIDCISFRGDGLEFKIQFLHSVDILKPPFMFIQAPNFWFWDLSCSSKFCFCS